MTATANFGTLNMSTYTGTLDTNGQAVNGTAFVISGVSTRGLTLGASLITLTGSGASLPWDATTTTGLTFNAGTSTITMSGAAPNFLGGGLTYNIVTFSNVTSVGVVAGSNNYTTLTITGGASNTANMNVTQSTTQTVSGTFHCNGNNINFRMFLTSLIAGIQATISAAVVDITNSDLMDINGIGAATWDLSGATGGSGDCGGNTLKALGTAAFTAATTQHWVAPGSGGGAWSTLANWTSRRPLPQDDVVIDFAFGTSQTVQADVARLGKSIDWSGATFTTALTWQSFVPNTSFGSLTFKTGMVTSGANQYNLRGRISATLTTAGVQIGWPLIFTAPNGTYTLQDNFATPGKQFRMNSGTFTAGNNSVTANDFLLPSSLFGGTVNAGFKVWTATGAGTPFNHNANITFNAQGSLLRFTDSSNSSLTFAGASVTYNNIRFSRGASTGTIFITGSNTFNDFADMGTGTATFSFANGTNTTVTSWNVSGTPGHNVTLASPTGATLTKAGGGVISARNLTLSKMTASPAATWYIGTNSIDSGGNTGFIFTNQVRSLSTLRTLVPGAQNLITHSEDLDNAAWSKSDATITADVVANPVDGLVTADAILDSSANTFHSDLTAISSVIKGRQYSCSFWAKSANLARTPVVLFLATGGVFSGGGVYFDLSDGTMLKTGLTAAQNGFMQSWGNGWYRCTVVGAANNSGASNFFLCPCPSKGTLSYIGDGTAATYIYGCQVTQTNVPFPPYAKTTTTVVDTGAPRQLAASPRTLAALRP